MPSSNHNSNPYHIVNLVTPFFVMSANSIQLCIYAAIIVHTYAAGSAKQKRKGYTHVNCYTDVRVKYRTGCRPQVGMESGEGDGAFAIGRDRRECWR